LFDLVKNILRFTVHDLKQFSLFSQLLILGYEEFQI